MMYLHTINITEENVMHLHHITIEEFEEWVDNHAPPIFHPVPLFHAWQVPVSHNYNTTTPIATHTPVPTQPQMVESPSHDSSHADNYPQIAFPKTYSQQSLQIPEGSKMQ